MDIDLDFSSPSSRRHVASSIDTLSANELKLAVIRAIDHAHKISAEMIENRAMADAALGQLAGLKNEVHALKQLLDAVLPGWEKLPK